MVTIADKTVLVTGANRGIGQRSSTKPSAGRPAGCMPGTRPAPGPPDGRRHALILDVTSAAQIQAAPIRANRGHLWSHNAGIALYDDLSDRAVLERHLAVNLFGTYAMTQAFLPALTRPAEPSSTTCR